MCRAPRLRRRTAEVKIGIAMDKADAPDLYRGHGPGLAVSSVRAGPSGFRAGGRRGPPRAADRRERRPGLCPRRRAGGAGRRVLEHRRTADPPDRSRERLADRAVPLAGARAHADLDHRVPPPRPPDRRVSRRRPERARRRGRARGRLHRVRPGLAADLGRERHVHARRFALLRGAARPRGCSASRSGGRPCSPSRPRSWAF